MTQVVCSLFPGVGLMDRAFEEEGFCVVRGPDVLWGGDIRSFHPPAGRFDGIVGGPPCQAFSTLSTLVRAKGHEPRFGDLFPEFARVVREAEPAWFLAENVSTASSRKAAASAFEVLDAYQVHSFTLSNESLGEEQERLRCFWFGWRGSEAPDLRRWIQLAPLMLPGRVGTLTQSPVDNSSEAKGRVPGQRVRTQTVLSTPRAVPVALEGSGKLKPGARKPSVTGANPGSHRPKGSHLVAEMLRLQGLPPDFLADAPFTVRGKRKAIANGVPLPMGRAIAKAVRSAVAGAESVA